MGLLTETVEIKINNRTYKHFEDLEKEENEKESKNNEK